MTLIGISGSHLPSSTICVSSSTISTFSQFLHSSAKLIRTQQVTIPTSFHPVFVQPSALLRSTFSCMAPECTAISLAVARFTSVTAARAREAREMHSVPIVRFGAEHARPRLMFNSSHNITNRFRSRCFVIKSAGLAVPRIFSILSSWFFSCFAAISTLFPCA